MASKRILITAIALSSIALAACSSSKSGGGSGSSGAATAPAAVGISSQSSTAQRETVKIGFIQALTGNGSLYAQTNSAALTVAEKEAAADGVTLDVVKGDDATDPTTAAQVCQRMVQQDHVVAIVGFEQDSAASACNQATKSAGIPQINADGIGGLGCISNLFGFAATPTQSVGTVANYLVKDKGLKNIYFFASDLPTNHSVLQVLKAQVAAAGGKIVGSSFEPFGTTDFSNDLAKIKSSGANAVVSGVAGNDSLVYHKQFATDPQVSSITSLELYPVAAGSTSASYLKGLYEISPYFSTISNATNTSLLADWKQTGQTGAPPANAIQVLYSIRMLEAAIKAAGSAPSASSILSALQGVSFAGPAGTWTESHHAAELPLYVAQADATGAVKIVKTTSQLPPGTTCSG